MAVANHFFLKGGGTLVSLSRYNRNLITINNGYSPKLSLSFSLLSPSKPSLSLLHSTTPSCRHFRRLCTSADGASVTSVESSPPSSSPAAPITAAETTAAPPAPPDMAAVKESAKMLEIRVGKILKAWRHPDADSLYVEEVDVGEDEPRTICSGLVKYVPIEDLQDKKVVVLANLKPRNMRGIKSSGMLMAASDASHENVELLVPPEDSVPGERIWFGLEEEKDTQPDAASANQIQKKKVWESVQPHLKTDAACIAMLDGQYMRTSAGPVISKSLKNANIS